MENFLVYTNLGYYFLCSANLGQIFSVILEMQIVLLSVQYNHAQKLQKLQ